MSSSISQVWYRSMEQIGQHVAGMLPPVLIAGVIMLAAWIVGRTVRWLLVRSFQGNTFDRFLQQSGIANLLGRPRHWKSAGLVAELIYALVLTIGGLMALSVFDTAATRQIVEEVAVLLPKLAVASVFLLAGAWLAQFAARTTLVWGVNQDIPHPRHWASGVRAVIFGLAIVIAADTLNFARYAFLATYLMLLGGVVLALSLTLGLRGRLDSRASSAPSRRTEETEHASLWNHL